MSRRCGWVAALCPPLFAGIVLYLQHIQPAYDWHNQFMSELALGSRGFLMYGAFGLLAAGAAMTPCF